MCEVMGINMEGGAVFYQLSLDGLWEHMQLAILFYIAPFFEMSA